MYLIFFKGKNSEIKPSDIDLEIICNKNFFYDDIEAIQEKLKNIFVTDNIKISEIYPKTGAEIKNFRIQIGDIDMTIYNKSLLDTSKTQLDWVAEFDALRFDIKDIDNPKENPLYLSQGFLDATRKISVGDFINELTQKDRNPTESVILLNPLNSMKSFNYCQKGLIAKSTTSSPTRASESATKQLTAEQIITEADSSRDVH